MNVELRLLVFPSL